MKLVLVKHHTSGHLNNEVIDMVPNIEFGNWWVDEYLKIAWPCCKFEILEMEKVAIGTLTQCRMGDA